MTEKRLCTVGSGGSGGSRQVVMVQDRHYIVKPMNKQKLKHRDRECILLDVVSTNEYKPVDKIAKVRFSDNNRQGRVDLRDLVPLGDFYEEEYSDAEVKSKT